MTLEDVLADYRGQAQVLRHRGHRAEADTIEEFADAVAKSARDYIDWLTEDEAALASGKSVLWFRHRFREWEDGGLARRDGEGRRARRLYRRLIVPRRPNITSAYQMGRKGEVA